MSQPFRVQPRRNLGTRTRSAPAAALAAEVLPESRRVLPGQSRYPARNAIVPVLRVPPKVAIEPVSHVQEFLGDNYLE